MYPLRILLVLVITCPWACAPSRERARERAREQAPAPGPPPAPAASPDLMGVLEVVYDALESGDAATLRQHLVIVGDEERAAGQLLQMAEDIRAIRARAAEQFGHAVPPLQIGADILPPLFQSGRVVVRGEEALLDLHRGQGFWFRKVGGRWRLAYTTTVNRLYEPERARKFLAYLDRLSAGTAGVRARLERAEFSTIAELQRVLDRDVGMRVEATPASRPVE